MRGQLGDLTALVGRLTNKGSVTIDDVGRATIEWE